MCARARGEIAVLGKLMRKHLPIDFGLLGQSKSLRVDHFSSYCLCMLLCGGSFRAKGLVHHNNAHVEVLELACALSPKKPA